MSVAAGGREKHNRYRSIRHRDARRRDRYDANRGPNAPQNRSRYERRERSGHEQDRESASDW